ncbi:hypothetical protein [Streptomyces sp. PSKA30]|uniref:hypothetical protein n=1 Tax=Streptomyces sp. PSKA30 TaxID=2874597 RepID=UPI001CD131F8|nr:hypothetical protein [Streptomyces sp. PSKA30]MBZ9645034.1 hypothetical protein [Streptomyces sp. PSKA30]
MAELQGQKGWAKAGAPVPVQGRRAQALATRGLLVRGLDQAGEHPQQPGEIRPGPL